VAVVFVVNSAAKKITLSLGCHPFPLDGDTRGSPLPLCSDATETYHPSEIPILALMLCYGYGPIWVRGGTVEVDFDFSYRAPAAPEAN